MEISEYLSFVGERLTEAANEGNKQEWIRLATVLIRVLEEQIANGNKHLKKR